MPATGTAALPPRITAPVRAARAARTALDHAAALTGLDTRGARILHEGKNHVFRLDGGVIAKVHTSRFSDVQREIRSAQALLAAAIHTAAPVGDGRPISTGGLTVTFTEDLGTARPSWGQLGEAAARLHRIPPLTGLGLPLMDRTTSAARRIDLLPPTVVSERDRARLRHLIARTADAYHSIAWPAPRTVHGDLNPDNAALLPDGTTALLDLETLSIGHCGFDQCAAAFARDAFGLDPAVHEQWADGYGHDITTANGGHAYRTLALLLGIGSALFYAEWGSSTRPKALPQARHRLDTLLAQRPFPWDWAPVDAVTTAPADTAPSAVNQPAPT